MSGCLEKTYLVKQEATCGKNIWLSQKWFGKRLLGEAKSRWSQK